ncbi:type II toxin-antitoxin system RelE/ParE family toxin [Roseateles paludis]|uniref:Type II toxin-antitoxin system RelE/ParE family toxin n=1 Tax=Roseateles paludis TaxID=3145238 RepID=A0ABV0FWN2_9BURK
MTVYRVVLAEEAAEDLLRIEDFLIARELASATPDLDVVQRLRDAIDRALRLLEFSPYSCRKAARALNIMQRELIVPFGNTGLIAAFEVRGEVVRIGAIRHQLEQDYH